MAAALLASSCGAEPVAPVGTPAPAGARLVATLGDSITAGSPLWDPVPGNRPAGADERSQFQYWARQEAPAFAFRNCGVLGERTDEIAERLDSCVAGADVLVVQGGTNDVIGRETEEIAGNLREMVRRGRRAGLTVLIADVPPWNTGHPEAAEPIRDLNRRIGAIAREEDVVLVEFFSALEDRENPDRMRAEWTDDGIHPNVAGHRRLGRVLARALRRAAP